MTFESMSLDELLLCMSAKATQFEKLAAATSHTSNLLRRAAALLSTLESERGALAAILDAACLARDTVGILGTPVDAITMLGEENAGLRAELDALRATPSRSTS
ncbi:hypothetical protein [Sphingobium indicum]|uniref:hypothetical protein n=1 Tax=Sphingobium indicum TaxID=332055 RepID=UPI00055D839A|nr:hypothetical protein [Sphingobium indicum]